MKIKLFAVLGIFLLASGCAWFEGEPSSSDNTPIAGAPSAGSQQNPQQDNPAPVGSDDAGIDDAFGSSDDIQPPVIPQ